MYRLTIIYKNHRVHVVYPVTILLAFEQIAEEEDEIETYTLEKIDDSNNPVS